MEAKTALKACEERLAGLRTVLQSVQDGEVSADEAVRRCDELLGPPVRVTEPARPAGAARACENLVDDCRRELDRARAGMVSATDTLAALRSLLARDGGR
jgi:hypothetical protein